MAANTKETKQPRYVHQHFPKHVYTRDKKGALVTAVVADVDAFEVAVKAGAVESPADLPEIASSKPVEVDEAVLNAVLEENAAKDATIEELKAQIAALSGRKVAGAGAKSVPEPVALTQEEQDAADEAEADAELAAEAAAQQAATKVAPAKATAKASGKKLVG